MVAVYNSYSGHRLIQLKIKDRDLLVGKKAFGSFDHRRVSPHPFPLRKNRCCCCSAASAAASTAAAAGSGPAAAPTAIAVPSAGAATAAAAAATPGKAGGWVRRPATAATSDIIVGPLSQFGLFFRPCFGRCPALLMCCGCVCLSDHIIDVFIDGNGLKVCMCLHH